MFPGLLLAELHITPTGAALIAAVCVAGLLFGAVLFHANREKMRIRGKFADCANVLAQLGFVRGSSIFKCLSIGDDIAALHDIEELTKMLLDPKRRESELDTLFLKMMEEKLENPADRQRTLDEITQRAASLGTSHLADIEKKIAAAVKDAFSGQVPLSEATLSGQPGAAAAPAKPQAAAAPAAGQAAAAAKAPAA